MSRNHFAAVVLAAGKGTRMKSGRPKVLHELAGRPMIGHLMATLGDLAPQRTVVVLAPGMEEVAAAAAPTKVAIQKEALGTGHAVLAAGEALADYDGDVLVLFADTPLLTARTMQRVLAARAAAPHPAVVVLGFRPADPGEYARLIVDEGGLQRIVEAKDATEAERRIELCNSGVMLIDGDQRVELLEAIGRDNAKGEYYLTDVVTLARAKGLPCAIVEGAEGELLGINARSDLAAAERIVQERLRGQALEAGVTLIDPGAVWLSADTDLASDVTIEPNVIFGPGVSVGPGATIRAFSHLEGAKVAAGATIGPFARLRPGADIGEAARIGNFVEVKAAAVGAAAKVNHLSYIGDARIGEGANVGAGTITCNYDGYTKSHTDIGAGAFIGSNTALVAPVTIGDGAVVGAGSVISKDVAADSLALTRAEQTSVAGWAKRKRAQKDSE